MKTKPFKHYEYRVFEIQGSLYSSPMVTALNKLGVQGWKLVKGPDETDRVNWRIGLFVREKT